MCSKTIRQFKRKVKWVRIMKKKISLATKVLTGTLVFSMLSLGQVSAATKVDQPTLKKINVKYKDKKITITGQADQIKKVRAVYNKTKKTVNVKSNKFTITLKYKNEKDIKLYGLNSKNKKVTKAKKVTSSRFVTGKLICNKITHTKKGITYELNTEAGSVVTAKYKGKVIKEEVVDSSCTRFFIPEKKIKGKKGTLTFTQKATSKRTSKKVALDIIKVGSVTVVNY